MHIHRHCCISYLLIAPLLVGSCLLLSLRAAANESILVRANEKQIGAATTAALADVGAPSTLHVKKSEKLGDLISRHCGRRDKAYLHILQKKAANYTNFAAPLSFESSAQSDQDMVLPFCLRLPKLTASKVIPVSTENSLASKKLPYLLDQPLIVGLRKPGQIGFGNYSTGYPGWAGNSTVVVNPSTWNSITTDRWTMDSWAGGQWGTGTPASRVEVLDGWGSLSLSTRTDKKTAQRIIVAALHKDNTALLDKDLRPTSVTDSEAKEIGHLTVLTDPEDKCPKEKPPSNTYPFDAMQLLHVIGLNQANGRLLHHPSQIVVADTGVSDATAARYGAALTRSGIQSWKERQPDKEYPKSGHGANVVSAALGGAYFDRFLKLMNDPIKIRPINIFQTKYGTLDEKHLANIMEVGTNSNAVINLSISYDKELKGLREVLKSKRNALFVAAAGNRPGQVNNEHPAALGGQFPNLIIVGSLKANGKPEDRQSTWSESNVELSAPGCRVPVHEDGEASKVVFRSGSSLAAPLVSFAAAILNKYNIGSPEDVKVRLLTSADFDPALENRVKRKLKLNIVRAVAISHDVIELNAPTAKPIYGRITKGDLMLLLCEGNLSMGRNKKNTDGKKNNSNSLLSLDIADVEGGKRLLVQYRVEASKNHEHRECPLGNDLAKHKITIMPVGSNEPQTFKLKDIRKFLFAIQ